MTSAPARMTSADYRDLVENSANKGRGRFPVSPKSARTMDGIVFDSKAEMLRYGKLRIMERAGEISRLELQPAFPITINAIKVCTVHLDFKYLTKAGDVVIEDAKSSGTARDTAYRLRKRLVEAAYGIKIVEV